MDMDYKFSELAGSSKHKLIIASDEIPVSAADLDQTELAPASLVWLPRPRVLLISKFYGCPQPWGYEIDVERGCGASWGVHLAEKNWVTRELLLAIRCAARNLYNAKIISEKELLNIANDYKTALHIAGERKFTYLPMK